MRLLENRGKLHDGGVAALVFGGSRNSLTTPLSASNFGSLCTKVAFKRCASAATNESAKETLCAAFIWAAALQRASSEWCQATGCDFANANSSAACCASRSCVRIYSSSVSVTKLAPICALPSHASARRDSTCSAPGSFSSSVIQAEVPKTKSSAICPLLGSFLLQTFRQPPPRVPGLHIAKP